MLNEMRRCLLISRNRYGSNAIAMRLAGFLNKIRFERPSRTSLEKRLNSRNATQHGRLSKKRSRIRPNVPGKTKHVERNKIRLVDRSWNPTVVLRNKSDDSSNSSNKVIRHRT